MVMNLLNIKSNIDTDLRIMSTFSMYQSIHQFNDFIAIKFFNFFGISGYKYLFDIYVSNSIFHTLTLSYILYSFTLISLGLIGVKLLSFFYKHHRIMHLNNVLFDQDGNFYRNLIDKRSGGKNELEIKLLLTDSNFWNVMQFFLLFNLFLILVPNLLYAQILQINAMMNLPLLLSSKEIWIFWTYTTTVMEFVLYAMIPTLLLTFFSLKTQTNISLLFQRLIRKQILVLHQISKYDGLCKRIENFPIIIRKLDFCK